MTKFNQFVENLTHNHLLPKLALGFLIAMAITAIIVTILAHLTKEYEKANNKRKAKRFDNLACFSLALLIIFTVGCLFTSDPTDFVNELFPTDPAEYMPM